jgi:hypothetical protein
VNIDVLSVNAFSSQETDSKNGRIELTIKSHLQKNDNHDTGNTSGSVAARSLSSTGPTSSTRTASESEFKNVIDNPCLTQSVPTIDVPTAAWSEGTGSVDLGPTTGGTCPAESYNWTSLLTSSMSILSSGGVGDDDNLNTDGRDQHFITRFLCKTRDTTPTDGGSLVTLDKSSGILNIDQSFESFYTPPSIPCAETGDKTSEIFFTPPPSPSSAAESIGPSIATSMGTVPTQRPVQTPISPGPVMPSTLGTFPETSPRTKALRTKRPRLSDVFVPQVPDIPAPNVDPGPVPMPSATLGPA